MDRNLRPSQVLVLSAGRGLRTLLYEDTNEADLREFAVRLAAALG